MSCEVQGGPTFEAMSLDGALAAVSGDRPEPGRTQPAQRHRSTAARALVGEGSPPPIGLTVRVSGSGQTLPKVPGARSALQANEDFTCIGEPL